jgi:MYXO-CTERM domain-containing protein
VTVVIGQSSTLTLTASPDASNGTSTFTVTATDTLSQSTESAQASASVSGGSSGGGGGCPPGTIDLGGGICIPTGCALAPARQSNRAPVAFLALAAFALLRRRRR